MTSQPDKNPVIANFELVVNVDNLAVTPRDNDLEVSAQFIVYGFGKTASKNIFFSVNPKYSPETLLEKILDSMKEHIAASLVATCRANLVESVFHAFEAKKTDTRENILKMYKEDFNDRNQVKKSSRQETEDEFFNRAILALEKLEEKGIETPTEEELAEALEYSVENLRKRIKKFPVFIIEDALLKMR